MPTRATGNSKTLVAGCGVALIVLVTASLALRTHFVRNQVLVGEEVRFAVADCWYHVRLVENLVHHFPHLSTFDPYGVFPGGQFVPVAPLFDWLLAAASLVVGGGQPSTRAVELVCAYAPAVLGALIVLPVYWLGARLLNRTAGLLAATLIVVAPGHFLSRSLLGYTDHHALEALLSAIVVLMLATALDRLRPRESGLETEGRRAWPAAASRAIPGALAGIGLGLYLLTWIGGSLLVGILAGWLLLQFLLDHTTGRPTGYLAAIALPAFVVAALIVFPWGSDLPGFRYHRVALLCAILLTGILFGLSRVANRWRVPRGLFPLVVALAGVLAAIVASVGWPFLVREVTDQLARLGSAHERTIIPEALPLLKVGDRFSLQHAWSQFTTGFFLAIPALVLLLLRAVRQRDPVALLVAIWSFAMLAITIAQNRFAYYYAANVAILSGYLGARLLAWGYGDVSGEEMLASSTHRPRSGNPQREAKPRVSPGLQSRWLGSVRVIGTSLGVMLLLIYPNIRPAMKAAARIATPHPDWIAAMRWLRENSPEPFGDPEVYYARHTGPPTSMDTAYGVMSSWGYGYWITRMAHRVPVANPGQRGAGAAAGFFLTEDVAVADAILEKAGAPYVVIESTMPYLATGPGGNVSGRLTSLSHWAGVPLTTLSETWYRPQPDGKLQPFRVYYPAYYRSMLARLYVFRGAACEPNEVFVMSFRERVTDRGEPYKQLVSSQRFSSYAEAQAFLATQPPEQTRLVGIDPIESCVPLEPALEDYQLVYQSPTVRCTLRGQSVSHVEIYEHRRISGAGKEAD